jgi:transcriptional regulator
MYLPTQFKEESVPAMHAAIAQARIGTLVTMSEDGMEASHVPMLVDESPAPYGTLIGHISKGNPQWRRTKTDVPALAMFLGPNAYITPNWYATKRQTGKVVPTWNYVAVHAYGTVRFFDDADELLVLVTRLTRMHEGGRTDPWAVTDAPADFIQAQLKGIVGFALPIARLEGKWKMSQNRPAEDRAGVVEGLRREGGSEQAIVADLVTAANDK